MLAVRYRGRPTTVAEFPVLAHLEPPETVAAVEDPRRRGLLGGAGEELVYTNPAFGAADAVATRSTALRRTAAEALTDLENIVSDVPEMLWDRSE